MQLQLPATTTLRSPKESAPVLEPDRHWCAIEVDPSVVGFTQQLACASILHVDREQSLILLRAILDDDAQRCRRFLPNDAREIGKLLAVPINPAGVSAAPRDDPETHLRVRCSRARIKVFRRWCFGMQRISDIARLDAAVVGLLISDRLRVWR